MAGAFFRMFCGCVALCVLNGLADGQHWIGTGVRVAAWTNSLPADRVRLGVKDEGVYRVTAEELASASGYAADSISNALATGSLALSNGVDAVAWTTDGGALFFYGVPTLELFAPENVYWVSFGAGTVMRTSEATPDPASSGTNQWFMSAQSFRSAFVAPYDNKDRRSSTGTLTNVLSFGEWIAATSTESSRARSKTVTLPRFCPDAQTGVVARVSVVSYKEFVSLDTHTCEVWLDGVKCGSASWTNEQALVFDCLAAQGAVTNGPVTITIRNGITSGSTGSDFLLLDVALIYPRAYSVVSNVLFCTGGGGSTAAVGGLATNAVGVWDVTDAENPAVLDAPLSADSNGVWSAVFACGPASSKYAVFEVPDGCFGPSVSGVRDVDWSAPGEMPELAIVIPPRRWISGFDSAVQPLVDFRRRQGLQTRVIDAEELYNAFTAGLVHPAAFQRFSAVGFSQSPTRLRYLLFAGHGGYDYKLDVYGFGNGSDVSYPTLFPLYQFPQVEESFPAAYLLPNDPVLGDANGDGVPDVAVGRFIARTRAELTNMVAKTIRYELVDSWRNKAVFTSCWEKPGAPDFDMIASNTAAGFASAGWTIAPYYGGNAAGDSDMSFLWDYGDNGPGVKSELTAGSGFLYYFGHAHEWVAGAYNDTGSALLNSDRIAGGSWPFAPVALLMGCRIGRWTLLYLNAYSPSVAEAGVRNVGSGFAAVICPSGFIDDLPAINYSYAFRDQIASGAVRLGDAWLGAFQQLDAATARGLQHMTFLGDPSLTIQIGATARGTPWPWMIAQGLTDDPYADLSDPDSDGFATWQEYQAGTDYLSRGLKIRSLSGMDSVSGEAALVFEPDAASGSHFRVLTATNLVSGVWDAVPWKASSTNGWSWSGIPADWPVKSVLVPFTAGAGARFYKMESSDE